MSSTTEEARSLREWIGVIDIFDREGVTFEIIPGSSPGQFTDEARRGRLSPVKLRAFIDAPTTFGGPFDLGRVIVHPGKSGWVDPSTDVFLWVRRLVMAAPGRQSRLEKAMDRLEENATRFVCGRGRA